MCVCMYVYLLLLNVCLCNVTVHLYVYIKKRLVTAKLKFQDFEKKKKASLKKIKTNFFFLNTMKQKEILNISFAEAI